MRKFIDNPSIKKILKYIWEIYINFYVFLNIPFPIIRKFPRIFYAGGRTGSIGGPLVKIEKLTKVFPDNKFKFNLVYIASNNFFITKGSLNIIKKRNIKIVLNQNGVFYPAWFKGNYKQKNLKMSEAYHAANYVFWQSNFCKKASNKFLGKRLGEGEVLYNAVDTNFLMPSKKNDKIFTFLITGNISKKNNYRLTQILIAFKEILKLNSNLQLIIAGNIEDKEYIFSKILQNKIREKISFLGSFKQIDAPKIYQLADAYVTITFQDNCPSTVIEAMSCGLPVLYSSSGGIPELVDINSGIGLEVKQSWEQIQVPNVNKIVDGMLKIIENKKSMSESARTRVVENFDLKNWLKRHEIIFNQFLS